MSIRSETEQTLVRIENVRDKADRPDPIKLEPAVKTRTPEECYEVAHALAELGRPTPFGRNRAQETRSTVIAIRQVEGAGLHLIDPLQSNKVNHALGCVDAIESVDCLVLVEKINARVNREVPIFLEVNILGEETKHRRHPSEMDALADAVFGAEHLRSCGSIIVGLNSPIEKDVRAAYAQLRLTRE